MQWALNKQSGDSFENGISATLVMDISLFRARSEKSRSIIQVQFCEKRLFSMEDFRNINRKSKTQYYIS